MDLLAETYTATDARLGVRVGTNVALQLDVGGGKAWRPGRDDIPYVLAGAQLLVTLVPRLHVAVEVEHERLRITNDPVRETYREGRLVSAEPLGRSRRWSHAASIGVMLGVSL